MREKSGRVFTDVYKSSVERMARTMEVESLNFRDVWKGEKTGLAN